MNPKDFGKLIAKLRKESGYKSQRKFAEATGVSNASIAKIEAGTQKARPGTLKAFSKHLEGITYSKLMELSGYAEKSDLQSTINEFEKFEFIAMVEDSTINFLNQMSINDRFFPFVEARLKKSLNNLGKDPNIADSTSGFIKYFENLNLHEQTTLYSEIVFIYSLPEVKQEIEYSGKKNISKVTENLSPKQEKLYEIVLHYNSQRNTEVANYEIVKPSLIGDNHAFALVVEDDSMSHAGILSGDTVVCISVTNEIYGPYCSGICVVLLGNSIVIRKVVYEEEDLVMLIPKNPEFDPELWAIEDVQIIGKVVQVIRTLK